MVARKEKFSNSRRSRMSKTIIFSPWWQPFNSFCFETFSFFPLPPFFMFTMQLGGEGGHGPPPPPPSLCLRPWPWSYTTQVILLARTTKENIQYFIWVIIVINMTEKNYHLTNFHVQFLTCTLQILLLDCKNFNKLPTYTRG